MSGRAPSPDDRQIGPHISPWLAGLFALEFLLIAGVTALLVLTRSSPEIIALFGMLMLAAAALPVWLILSARRSTQDEDAPATHSPDASRLT